LKVTWTLIENFSILQIDSFVLDEQEEEAEGDLSEDDEEDDEDDDEEDEVDSRLEDEDEDEDDDLEEDSEDDEDDEEDLEDLDNVDNLKNQQRFLLRQGKDLPASAADLDVVDGVVSAAAAGDIYPPFDPETQAKLEDLFETAGFGKLSGDTKQFTDPEVS